MGGWGCDGGGGLLGGVVVVGVVLGPSETRLHWLWPSLHCSNVASPQAWCVAPGRASSRAPRPTGPSPALPGDYYYYYITIIIVSSISIFNIVNIMIIIISSSSFSILIFLFFI